MIPYIPLYLFICNVTCLVSHWCFSSVDNRGGPRVNGLIFFFFLARSCHASFTSPLTIILGVATAASAIDHVIHFHFIIIFYLHLFNNSYIFCHHKQCHHSNSTFYYPNSYSTTPQRTTTQAKPQLLALSPPRS